MAMRCAADGASGSTSAGTSGAIHNGVISKPATHPVVLLYISHTSTHTQSARTSHTCAPPWPELLLVDLGVEERNHLLITAQKVVPLIHLRANDSELLLQGGDGSIPRQDIVLGERQLAPEVRTTTLPLLQQLLLLLHHCPLPPQFASGLAELVLQLLYDGVALVDLRDGGLQLVGQLVVVGLVDAHRLLETTLVVPRTLQQCRHLRDHVLLVADLLVGCGLRKGQRGDLFLVRDLRGL